MNNEYTFDYENSTKDAIIDEWDRVRDLCFWSDMSSDCGSLGSGRDRDLFSYKERLMTAIRTRFGMGYYDIMDYIKNRG